MPKFSRYDEGGQERFPQGEVGYDTQPLPQPLPPVEPTPISGQPPPHDPGAGGGGVGLNLPMPLDMPPVESGGGGPVVPPPGVPAPTSVPGSFASPSMPGMMTPFRTAQFPVNRFTGSAMPQGMGGFGAGAKTPGLDGQSEDEELLRRYFQRGF